MTCRSLLLYLASAALLSGHWIHAADCVLYRDNDSVDSQGAEQLEECPVIDQVDWAAVLAQQDMIWKKLPRNWKEAPFLGNGELGTMMYQLDKRTLRWDVGCSAAHDHRPFEEDDFSEKNVVTLNRGRHFIGHLEMKVPANLTGGTARLALWDAEATGTLTSAAGSADWTALVHANQPVMRFEWKATGDLKGAAFTYVAEAATNPRAQRAKTPRTPANPVRSI